MTTQTQITQKNHRRAVRFFAGALEDGVQLGVSIPLLHRVVGDVAPAAHRLDGPLGRLDRHLAGGHRPGLLEGAQRRRPGPVPAGDGFAGLGEFVFEFFLSAKQIGFRDANAREPQLGGVRRAAAQLVEFAYQLKPGSAARDR